MLISRYIWNLKAFTLLKLHVILENRIHLLLFTVNCVVLIVSHLL